MPTCRPGRFLSARDVTFMWLGGRVLLLRTKAMATTVRLPGTRSCWASMPGVGPVPTITGRLGDQEHLSPVCAIASDYRGAASLICHHL